MQSQSRISTTLRGGEAERVACDYLCARGYRVLETNYRSRRGELDIVAEDEAGVRCFVEGRPRTRGPRDFGRPGEPLSSEQLRRITRPAREWVLWRAVDASLHMRFDVVGVVFEADAVTLELIRDAFQAN